MVHGAQPGGGGPVLTHSVVTDWDRLEELCPEEVAVLARDAPLSPPASWVKVAKLLVEGFGVPAMLVLPGSLLATCSYGHTTAMLVGCSASTSCTAREWGGYVLLEQAFHSLSHCGAPSHPLPAGATTLLLASPGAWLPSWGSSPGCLPRHLPGRVGATGHRGKGGPATVHRRCC